MRLDELWQDYVESVHMAAEEHEVDEHAMQYYKESGWEMVGKDTKKNTFYLAATPFNCIFAEDFCLWNKDTKPYGKQHA